MGTYVVNEHRPEPGLPERYWETQPLRAAFASHVAPALGEGVRILDVGAGREPAIPLDARPPRTHYAGFDVSQEELAAAAAGAYDELVVGDAVERRPELEGRFDLLLSYQALEHVASLERTLAGFRAYLRPGGRTVVLLAGAFSAFALANRLLPRRAGVALMRRLLGRDPETVFRAHYDRCWYGALEGLLAPWAEAEIVPFYLGARYFAFSRPLQRVYVRYEDWALAHGHRNLATHYLVDAVR